jgi:hypothetical protein
MNNYPSEYIEHLFPLVKVCGKYDFLESFMKKRNNQLTINSKLKLFKYSTSPIAFPSLSPNNPNSVLYPDGIMHPSWLKKHSEIIPSVLIMFIDYNDFRTDYSTVVSQVLSNKRYAQKGTRFITVIFNSEINNVEHEKFNGFKKACQLESKSIFIAFGKTVWADFMTNLEKTLYESVILYYRENGKRVKRKKSKLSIKASNGVSAEGWSLRYDFKMGAFAEFMQDLDLASRHYITAYNELMEIFKQTEIKPNSNVPQLKLKRQSHRWGELKVLADCLSFKISKFLMLGESPVDSLFQFNRHNKFFRQLSLMHNEKPSLSFEYWAWVSCQYALFAELIDLLKVELPEPAIFPAPNSDMNYLVADTPLSLLFHFKKDVDISGDSYSPSNISICIYHSGFYYMMAGISMIRRRKCLLSLEKSMNPEFPLEFQDFLSSIMPQERTVDHLTLAIDLYTKAYERFKKHKASRMTLYIAGEIADAYMLLEKYDLALKYLF